MVFNKQEKERLPATLKRSPAKAQATYVHTLESAEQQHGDGEAAHRIAFGSLKHSFEKVDDHWEPKDEPGPSDDQDAKTGVEARTRPVKTAGGVDARATKAHLLEVAPGSTSAVGGRCQKQTSSPRSTRPTAAPEQGRRDSRLSPGWLQTCR
jgi:cation transport regulator ChaB